DAETPTTCPVAYPTRYATPAIDRVSSRIHTEHGRSEATMPGQQGAAIYCRVSTDQQVGGTSLTRQRSQCIGYATAAGWSVTAVFVDEGISGASADRPALDELLALCEQRATDVVASRSSIGSAGHSVTWPPSSAVWPTPTSPSSR